VGRASDLLKVHGEQLPLRALKAAGAEGNLEAVAEYSRTLTEQKEQLVEVGWVRSMGSTSRRFCPLLSLIFSHLDRKSWLNFIFIIYLSHSFINIRIGEQTGLRSKGF